MNSSSSQDTAEMGTAAETPVERRQDSPRSYEIPAAPWDIEGGERNGGPNVLPSWSVFREEFPDTTGKTGAGIVDYSRYTFAYLKAEEPVARMMIAAPDMLAALKLVRRIWSPMDRCLEIEAIDAAIAKAEGRAND